jgi:tripeptide aminopeptidase
MEAIAHLIAHPEIPHGPIRVCFTCDEEIGHGVDHIDLRKLGADVAYTLDGAGQAEIEGETFSADKATVTITGVNIHPSIGKGRMVNAIRLAAMFVDRLPRQFMSPETTEGREGFIHPVTIDGGVAQTTIRLILRDHHTPNLAKEAELLRQIADHLVQEFPKAKIDIAIEKQYRNMADGMGKEPRAIRLAEEAVKRAGLTPKFPILRGGTDGARLTELGLPTPNLSTGEHNPHSPLEWTSLEDMQSAVKVLIELAQVWGRERK